MLNLASMLNFPLKIQLERRDNIGIGFFCCFLFFLQQCSNSNNLGVANYFQL